MDITPFNDSEQSFLWLLYLLPQVTSMTYLEPVFYWHKTLKLSFGQNRYSVIYESIHIGAPRIKRKNIIASLKQKAIHQSFIFFLIFIYF